MSCLHVYILLSYLFIFVCIIPCLYLVFVRECVCVFDKIGVGVSVECNLGVDADQLSNHN